MPPMAPEITIGPSEGENFPVKKVHVSTEALLAAAPDVMLADLNILTGQKTVSDAASRELHELAKALVDAAKKI